MGFTVQNGYDFVNKNKEMEGGRVIPGPEKKNFPEFLASLSFLLNDLGLRVGVGDFTLASCE